MPPSGPASGNQAGKAWAQLLDQAKEVVGAVDLVDLAVSEWPTADPRAVDPQRDLELVADDLLGLPLRGEVGMVELLALVEHVLAEEAVVAAGHRERGDVVQEPGPARVGELDGVAGPVHVGLARALLVGLHVVDRREVEEVVDLLVEVLDAEGRLRQVAVDRDDAVIGPEAGEDLVEAPARTLADEGVDRALALEQRLEEVPADEARGPGDEVIQDRPLLRSVARARVYLRGTRRPFHRAVTCDR